MHCQPTPIARALAAPPLLPAAATPLLQAAQLGRRVHPTQRELVGCPTPGCSTPLRPENLEAHLRKCPVLAHQRFLAASG